MPAHLVVEPTRDSRDRSLELGIRERAHAPADVADQMVVVLAAGERGLVAGGARSDVEPLHEAEPLEQLERAVDGCDPDPLVPEPVGDVACREHAFLLTQQLDHPGASSRRAVAGIPDASFRVLGPSFVIRAARWGRTGPDGCSVGFHGPQTIAVLTSGKTAIESESHL